MNKKKSKDRVLFLDALRVLATAAVMMLHTSAFKWKSPSSFESWQVQNVFDGISRWGVPVFVMISGAVFLNRSISIETFLRKYIPRIVTAFLFWSAVYTVFYAVQNLDKNFRHLVWIFISGHYHMWFCYMIVGLYLIVPFIAKIVLDKKLTKWFLLLSFLFAIVIPQIIAISEVLWSQMSDLLTKINGNINISFVKGFSFYFVLGFFLKEKKLPRIPIGIAGIAGFISTVWLTRWLYLFSGKPDVLFYGSLTINVMCESIFMFEASKWVFKEDRYIFTTKIGRVIVSVIHELAVYSFGAYLVHALILEELDVVCNLNNQMFHNTALAILLTFLIVWVISYSVSIIMHHIPIIGKYIT